MRMYCAIGVLGLTLLTAGGTEAGAQEAGPLAHWAFREGKGDVLGDAGGRNLNGRIVNAAWVKTAFGTGLRFDGQSAHVDCGAPKELALTGDLTVTAWVQLEATQFPNGTTNWHIIDNYEYSKCGYMLRVEGCSARLSSSTNQEGASQNGWSRGLISNGVPHHVALMRRGAEGSFFIDGQRDDSFFTKDPLPPNSSFRIGALSQSFEGVIYDVRVYGRALSDGEMLALFAQDAKRFGKDISWSAGKIALKPFLRAEEKKLIVEADFRGVMPLPRGAQLFAVMASADGREVSRQTVSDSADTLRQQQDVVFDLSAIAPGEYEARLVCDRVGSESAGVTRLTWPPALPRIPAPAEWTAPALPTPVAPPKFALKATEQGGLLLAVNGRQFRVESRFGRPGGGENCLVTGPKLAEADPAWTVKSSVSGPERIDIAAEGSDYRIERRVTMYADRLVVTDTLRNRLKEPVGIPFLYRVACDEAPLNGFVSGGDSKTVGRKEQMRRNPTVFLKFADVGMGLVALDDVFIVQSRGGFDSRGAELGSRELALDAGATIKLEWAVYLNATGDYYDFINAVRRDEGRNSVTVRGGFIVVGEDRDRQCPSSISKEYVQLRGARYVVPVCNWHPDDPQVTIEGLEFMEYPKDRDLLRKYVLAIRSVDPGLECAIHLHNNLYLTNRPAEMFPDSRIILAGGTQATYGDAAEFWYISRARQAENWHWWLFYPTPENSFGKTLLRSVDVMVDEIGCGAFVDGFMDAPEGCEYTYDRWDGCSADLDPQTHRILRKKGSVLLLEQPALVAFVERMRARGATVFANGATVTRTVGKLDVLTDKEMFEGPDMHLAQTPLTLGNPRGNRDDLEVYRDVLAKLHWGSLYLYYGEQNLKYPSVPQQMYPITVKEIGAGIVRGAERVVTARSGVYGWPGERDLHFAYRYDARGHLASHDFTTTVDASGVRTGIALGKDECAVVKRIPLSLNAGGPVNVVVTRYDAQGVELLLSAHGQGEITVRGGEMPVPAKSGFSVQVGQDKRVLTSDAAGTLRIPIAAGGSTLVVIAPVAP